MRISNRGTVTMGPAGWLLLSPFLLAVWVVLMAVHLVAWLVTLAARRVRAWRRRRRVPDWARRMPAYRPRPGRH